MLSSDLFSTHKGSAERERIWCQIAERLNEVSSCKFNVGQKSLRVHLKLLMQTFKEKMRTEERASGIDAEMTEIDVMLKEICEKEEVAEDANDTKKKNYAIPSKTAATTVSSNAGPVWKDLLDFTDTQRKISFLTTFIKYIP